MRRRNKLILLCLGLWVVLSICYRVADTAAVWRAAVEHDETLNDARLARLVAEFDQLEHPSDTQLVRRYTDLGLLWTGGNGCRFFVAELRRYSVGRDALAKFYGGQGAVRFKGGVAFFAERRIQAGDMDWLFQIYRQDASEWGLAETDVTDDLYVIFLYEYGGPPDMDLRCN